MRNADTILTIHRDRGSKGLHLERVYKHLFDPEFFLRAYGKIYRNAGAMTRGTTRETVDGMDLQKIQKIIDLLRQERYVWTPVRRTEIPKANGKMRPLGIPSWSDKLVQEVLRTLLEPYYEQKFSKSSHGFRPGRSCHSALGQVRDGWKGTVWFVEGDIKGCFDNIDHAVLLEIIRGDIHDGRLIGLIDGLLGAGYMENREWRGPVSGTPQGGIISPLLANIYLDQLDRFVEGTLLPAYTRGKRRHRNMSYQKVERDLARARKNGDRSAILELRRALRQLNVSDPMDDGFRRLRYVRYADDFLLGFIGPKDEAEVIRDRLAEYLKATLKLDLSVEKTLVTHARTDKAKFLGYELTATWSNTRVSADGRRNLNGVIGLLMPRKVADKVLERYGRSGKSMHRAEVIADDDFTIITRYQAVLKGIYHYYCMAVNVAKRMSYVKYILETSLTKTLANKHRISVREVYKKYQGINKVDNLLTLQVIVERPGKDSLIAIFGGFSLSRKREGMGADDDNLEANWFGARGSDRSEIIQRLLRGKCEVCGAEGLPNASRCITFANSRTWIFPDRHQCPYGVGP